MIMLPLISVIVPVYNVQQYLDKCICSILQQTLVDFELILVDDGSTDTSGSICDDYALRDSRIVVIHQKNGGQSEARNVALSISQGQYVIFIDSDDYVEHDMLEYLYKMIVNSNSDVAQCGYTKVYNDSVNDYPLNSKINTITIKGTEKILTAFFKGDSVDSVIWNKIYPRSFFRDLKFPVGQTMEDHFLLSDILLKSTQITVSTCVKYFYLQRENSIMKQNLSLNHMRSSFAAYKNRIKVANEVKNSDLICLSRTGLASDIFQYYRLIHFRQSSDEMQMYLELKKEHKLYKNEIWSNKMISLKFKIMLEILYIHPRFIVFFTKK